MKRKLYSIVIYYCLNCGLVSTSCLFYFLLLWKTTRYFFHVCQKITLLYCYWILFEFWAGVNFLFFIFLWKMTRYFLQFCEKLTVFYCYWLLFELWAGVNFLFLGSKDPLEPASDSHSFSQSPKWNFFESTISQSFFMLLLLNFEQVFITVYPTRQCLQKQKM